jgi:hypothetical protein
MATTYEIELRPHIGTCAKDGELIEVEHDQWIVIAARNGLDPKQVGYLAKRPDAELLPLARTQQRMGPYLYGEMCKSVEAARDAKFQGATE